MHGWTEGKVVVMWYQDDRCYGLEHLTQLSILLNLAAAYVESTETEVTERY